MVLDDILSGLERPVLFIIKHYFARINETLMRLTEHADEACQVHATNALSSFSLIIQKFTEGETPKVVELVRFM